MCGRYSLTKEAEHVARLFALDVTPVLGPRYNIAPLQPLGVVARGLQDNQNRWRHMQWGLVPSWTRDPSIGQRMINARSETAASKHAFRSALKYRRCLIPANGFYEWKRVGSTKQPHHITLTDGGLFAFAGLWEHWQSDDGSELESCAILTTTPNELLRHIHDRMPVILRPEHHDAWLDPSQQDGVALTPLLRPLSSELMTARLVSSYVNSSQHEGPRCIEGGEPQTLF